LNLFVSSRHPFAARNVGLRSTFLARLNSRRGLPSSSNDWPNL
jgi:hypothetical protein